MKLRSLKAACYEFFSCVWRAQIMIIFFLLRFCLSITYHIFFYCLFLSSLMFVIVQPWPTTFFFAPGSWRQRRQGIYKIRFSDYASKCFSTPVIVLWFTETNETLCTRRNHHCQWHSLFSFKLDMYVVQLRISSEKNDVSLLDNAPNYLVGSFIQKR